MNALLDRLPLVALRLDRGVVGVYTIAVIVGFGAASTALWTLAAVSGASGAVALAVPAWVGAVWLTLGRLHQRWSGSETHVLLENLLVSLGLVGAATWAAGLPPLVWLDLLVTAAALGLSIGRVGCAASGCCYGLRSDLGIAYPATCAAGPARRFPVQLAEAALWFTLGLAGAAGVLTAAPGRAASLVLVAYGVGRWCLEAARGDARPHLWGWSESRWLALVAVAIGVGIAWWTADRSADRWALGAGVAAAGASLAVGGRWVEGWREVAAPAEADALRAFGQALARARPGPRPMGTAVGRWSLSATWSRDGASTWLTVGLRGARPADEEIRALFALVAEGLGAQGEPPWSWDGEAAWAEIGVAGAPGWDAERPPGDPPAAPSPSAYFDRGATDVRGHGREAPPDR